MRGIASKCSSTANTWPRRCRRCFGSLEEADQLFAAVQGQRAEIHDVRDILLPRGPPRHAADLPAPAGSASSSIPKASIITTWTEPIDSYKGWRVGLPPQWYPTHSNAYYIGVTGGSFTEVSCMGMPSGVEHLQPAEQPLQKSVRHRDRAVPHQRRRHVAHGGQLGYARRRRRDGPRFAGRRARSTASTTGLEKNSAEH